MQRAAGSRRSAETGDSVEIDDIGGIAVQIAVQDEFACPGEGAGIARGVAPRRIAERDEMHAVAFDSPPSRYMLGRVGRMVNRDDEVEG